MFFLKKLTLEPMLWRINKNKGIEINPENDTDLIIIFSSLMTKLSALIKTWDVARKNKDMPITIITFDTSSLKFELLRFVELKNSIGKNRINKERKNMISAQKRVWPVQDVTKLLSLFKVVNK